MNRKIIYFLSAFLLTISSSYPTNVLDEKEYVPKARVKTIKGEETNLFTGLFYKIRLKSTAKVLDSLECDNRGCMPKSHSIKKADDLNSDQEGYNYQVWSLIKASLNEPYYTLQTMGNTHTVLDSGADNIVYKNFTTWPPYESTHSDYNRQIWSLESSNDGYILKSKYMCDHSNNIRDDNGQKVKQGSGSGSIAIWEFIPVNYKLAISIADFKYEPFQPEKLAKQVEVFHTTISNQKAANTPDQSTIMIDKTARNSVSWSFSESKEKSFLNQLEVNVNVTAQFSPIPLTAKDGSPTIGIGLQGGVKNTTTWGGKTTILEETRKENIDETKFSQSYTVAIPPKKKVDVSMSWKKYEGNIPYTATAKVTAVADRLKINKSVKKGIEVTSDDLITFLRSVGYGGNKIVLDGQDKKTALITLTGEYHIDNALYGSITTSDSSL